MHVDSNDAWVCAAARVTDDNDVDYTDPELEDDETVDEGDPVGTDGELDEEVEFAFWLDDGDNVFEDDERIFLQGDINELEDQGQMALADSRGGIFGQIVPARGREIFYIGKYWCFGDMTSTDVAQDSETTSGPLDGRGTGFECDGSRVNNAPQTDEVRGDLQFYAEQSRNNPEFECSNWKPNWETEYRLVLENKNPNNWDEILNQDGTYGILIWEGDGPTFDFNATFEGFGLTADTNYALVYAPDPWPQGIGVSQVDGTANGNTELGTGTSDGDGNLTISNEVDLDHDLPHPNDANYPGGAKIWLVLDTDHSGQAMTGWNPEQYLFETELIQYEDTFTP